MTDVDALARRASDGLRGLLARLATLAAGLVVLCLVIGLATYASGLAATDGDVWPVLGAVISFGPAVVAGLAWWRIVRARRAAPRALDDLRGVFLDREARPAAEVLIDYDTGTQIVRSSRSFNGMLLQLQGREGDWPALVETLKAVVTVPGLAALAVLGMLVAGAIGTVMLLIALL